MGILEVSKPFLPGRSYYPEGARFSLDEEGPALYLFVASPTREEVREVRKGRLSIGLLSIPPALFIPFRFGEMPWSEAVYSPHLLPEERRPGLRRLCEIRFAPGTGLLLQVVLVDASTGIVLVLRGLGLPTKLSEELLKEVKRLEESPWPGRPPTIGTSTASTPASPPRSLPGTRRSTGCRRVGGGVLPQDLNFPGPLG